MGATGSKILLEIVCPAAGTLVAQAMWIAPWTDVHVASARGELGDLNPMPWIFMLGNTIGCTLRFCFYDLISQRNILFRVPVCHIGPRLLGVRG